MHQHEAGVLPHCMPLSVNQGLRQVSGQISGNVSRAFTLPSRALALSSVGSSRGVHRRPG
eukprot:32421-Eustigmatos_ZCMA.PRE.1